MNVDRAVREERDAVEYFAKQGQGRLSVRGCTHYGDLCACEPPDHGILRRSGDQSAPQISQQAIASPYPL